MFASRFNGGSTHANLCQRDDVASLLMTSSGTVYTGYTEDLAACLGLSSLRVVNQLLHRWRSALTSGEHVQLMDYQIAKTNPAEEGPFPQLDIAPDFDGSEGPLLECWAYKRHLSTTSNSQTPNSTMAKTKELSKDTRNKLVDLHQAGKTESAIGRADGQRGKDNTGIIAGSGAPGAPGAPGLTLVIVLVMIVAVFDKEEI
ncbi:hypothetical protein QTP86_005626 [Hemibagrus guttatus]|nr:hypothetical protein QTP86_005626 [Hemibagrus guttatus]